MAKLIGIAIFGIPLFIVLLALALRLAEKMFSEDDKIKNKK